MLPPEIKPISSLKLLTLLSTLILETVSGWEETNLTMGPVRQGVNVQGKVGKGERYQDYDFTTLTGDTDIWGKYI